MAFFNIDDLGVSVPDFREDGEVVMVREVAGLDVELVEHIMVADPVSPNLLQDCVLELMVQNGVVRADYDELLPVQGHVLIDHNFSVGHRIIYQIILRLVLCPIYLEQIGFCKNLSGRK